MEMRLGLPVPTRFEDDCPEAAGILADICKERDSDKSKGRHKPIFLDGTMPVVQSENVGRNEPCPCGSNLKYKRCCLNN